MSDAATVWGFSSAERLCFGWDASRELGGLFAARDWRRIFIVTDPVLVEAGVVATVRRSLDEAGLTVEVFADGEPEPKVETAVVAAEQARRFSPDAILGLGGGSNIDLSKIAAILYTHGGEPAAYFSWDNVPGAVVPLVAVPTTAGTGSEVSHAAVLTDAEQQIKVSTLSPYLRPTLALVDPKLTLSCPPKVTADSGVDALTHAVEAYLATEFGHMPRESGDEIPYDGSGPLTDLLAERAISLIGRHLRTAVAKPDDRPAREGMALAATLAGLAFSNAGVALVHALEYPLGGAVHCTHGAGNGLLLPYVMRFNLPVREEKIARIGQLLGVAAGGRPAAEAALAEVEQLRRDIGVPHQLRELGASREQLPAFARKAFAIGRLRETNPRQASEADLLAILEAAF